MQEDIKEDKKKHYQSPTAVVGEMSMGCAKMETKTDKRDLRMRCHGLKDKIRKIGAVERGGKKGVGKEKGLVVSLPCKCQMVGVLVASVSQASVVCTGSWWRPEAALTRGSSVLDAAGTHHNIGGGLNCLLLTCSSGESEKKNTNSTARIGRN